MLVASSKPLPSYAEWSKSLGDLPWKPALIDTVWRIRRTPVRQRPERGEDPRRLADLPQPVDRGLPRPSRPAPASRRSGRWPSPSSPSRSRRNRKAPIDPEASHETGQTTRAGDPADPDFLCRGSRPDRTTGRPADRSGIAQADRRRRQAGGGAGQGHRGGAEGRSLGRGDREGRGTARLADAGPGAEALRDGGRGVASQDVAPGGPDAARGSSRLPIGRDHE